MANEAYMDPIKPGTEFLRAGDKIDITRYLPAFLKKSGVFKATADAESAEHARISAAIQDVFKQFYISDATWGLKIWENVLGITPKDGATDFIRRANILTRLRGLKTSTLAVMEGIVNTYGSGYIIEHNDRYYFNVYCSAPSKTALQAIHDDIVIYRPAHLGLNIYLGYSWDGDICFDGSHTFETYNLDWSEDKV